MPCRLSLLCGVLLVLTACERQEPSRQTSGEQPQATADDAPAKAAPTLIAYDLELFVGPGGVLSASDFGDGALVSRRQGPDRDNATVGVGATRVSGLGKRPRQQVADSLRHRFESHGHVVTAVYERTLTSNPRARGTVVLRFTAGTNGKLRDFHVVRADRGLEQTARHVAINVGWAHSTFRAPAAAHPYEFTQEFSFEPPALAIEEGVLIIGRSPAANETGDPQRGLTITPRACVTNGHLLFCTRRTLASIGAALPPNAGDTLTQPAVDAVAVFHRDELQPCYSWLALHRRHVSGGMMLRFDIDASGTVSSVSVPMRDVDDDVANCTVALAEKWRFPPPRGYHRAEVWLPLRFERPDSGKTLDQATDAVLTVPEFGRPLEPGVLDPHLFAVHEYRIADDAHPRCTGGGCFPDWEGVEPALVEGDYGVAYNVENPAGDAPLSGAAIETAFTLVRRSIMECYDQALRSNPALAGQLVVDLLAGSDGRVTKLLSSGRNFDDPGLTACVDRNVAALRFPPWLGAAAMRIKYPFHFRRGSGSTP